MISLNNRCNDGKSIFKTRYNRGYWLRSCLFANLCNSKPFMRLRYCRRSYSRPFSSCCEKYAAANQLVDRIDVRLGDGLSVIHPEDVIDNITICGMGGPLIAKILKDGQDKLSQHPRLILQSNIQTENLSKHYNN